MRLSPTTFSEAATLRASGLSENDLGPWLRSLDTRPVSCRTSLRQTLKQILKRILNRAGLRTSPHGQDQTRSFFVSLYAEPARCPGVVLRVLGATNLAPGAESACWINGVLTILERVGDALYLAPAESFSAYENIITFDRRLEVKDVEAYPLVPNATGTTETMGLDDGILTRAWILERSDGSVAATGERDLGGTIRDDLPPALSCLLNARITDPSSPFRGLYYPAFDLDHRTYRLQSWVWTNGIIVRTLLEESRRSGDARLGGEAVRLARRMLDFQATDGECAGSFMARWDIFNESPTGVAPIYATNDSAFAAAHALIPCHEATGDPVFLNAALRLGHWIVDKGMREDGQLLIGYRNDTGAWMDNYMFVDGGFTATLFAELYRVTGDDAWKHTLTRFMDWFVDALYDRKRQWFWRMWYTYRPVAREVFTRGQGWALDGLLAAYETTDKEAYAEVIQELAGTLLRHQSADGTWPYILDRPNSGACTKATPILAYHLLRAWRLFGEDAWRDAALRALDACDADMDMGRTDARSYGGIHRRSTEGCIYGPSGVSSVFMYGQCYYLLAHSLP